MSNSELKRTANWYRCVGTLYETGLKLEDCEIKLYEDGKPNGTTPGQRVMGNISVKTDSGIHTFSVYGQNLTSKGESAKQWKMYSDMLEWNPQINGNSDTEPTLVNIEGSVEINDYVNQKGEVSSSLRWRVSRANTKVSPDDPNGVTLQATLLVGGIKAETRNEEETGRLVVNMYGANNKGECFPIVAYVNEDMADDFQDCYESGMTVPFEFELNSRHIGGTAKAGKKKFGRDAEVTVNSGFDVQELVLVGGDDEIEEPDELTTEDENGNEVEVKTAWINPAVMKKAIKERAKMLEELKNNPPKKGGNSGGNSSLKAKKDAAKNKMKAGMSAKKTEDFDDDEDSDDFMPF